MYIHTEIITKSEPGRMKFRERNKLSSVTKRVFLRTHAQCVNVVPGEAYEHKPLTLAFHFIPSLYNRRCPKTAAMSRQTCFGRSRVLYVMSTVPPIFSQEDFFLFHRIDRDLYRILVFNLLRDPTESIYILSLWLWLERVGFRNVVRKILTLPSILINEVADESVTCLNCINPNQSQGASSSEPSDISLLQNIVDGSGGDISLQFFCKNKNLVSKGVEKMVYGVGIRAFSDIMQNVMMLRNAAAAAAAAVLESRSNAVIRPSNASIWFGSIGPSNLTEFDDAGIEYSRVQNPTPIQEDVPADDRTMFVTFSRGYPVEEWEVREFFGRRFGDCIEDLYMQEVPANEQSLFARIVFRQLSIIEMILKGVEKAKFAINGKHVWARKFVPKQSAAGSRLAPTPQ